MTIECTIRWNKPRTAEESTGKALSGILTTAEAETARFIIGGFYFATEKTPGEIFAAFEADGFEMEDFKSIEFATK
ncbi:MAG: hypothetical protein GYB50_04020 [Rhodobacteraceae bacterium]|nr:hypothetical protein [Paracoccaceae bacterium]